MKNYSRNKIPVILFCISFLIRIMCILLFADLANPEMWEFGIIARNLLKGLGYSYPAISMTVVSAHMPPGLAYIYYGVFLIFGDNSAGYFIILLLNSLLASFSVIIIYFIAEKVYNNKSVSLMSGLYGCMSPTFVYSTITFNSIIIYQLLLGISFLLFLKISYERSLSQKRNDFKKSISVNVLILSIVFGLFFYFRAEMIAFMLLISLSFIIRRQKTQALLVVFVSLIILSPWTIRNYIVFGRFVPITTSLGFNFNLGHGEDNIEKFNEIKNSLREDSTYEIKMSEALFSVAIETIKNDYERELKESLNKVFGLWLYDKYRSEARHPLYILIWGINIFLFFVGIIRTCGNKKMFAKLNFMLIYLIFSTILVVIFFNIPRYQIQMSYTMVPTMMYGLYEIMRLLGKGGKNSSPL